jgi:hypothetical protein
MARRLQVGTWNRADFVRQVANMSPAKSRELAQAYLFELQRAGGGPGKARIIDKLPHNFEFLGFIALLFPNARIIHSRRDPIDTCVSCFTHIFTDAHGYNRDLRTLGLYYRDYVKLMDHWREILPLKMYENSYESLVAEQEAQSRALISFLGLEWEEGVLRFHETERAVHTPSAWQVRQPIYKSSMKAWKKYEKHLGPLIEALGDLAEV